MFPKAPTANAWGKAPKAKAWGKKGTAFGLPPVSKSKPTRSQPEGLKPSSVWGKKPALVASRPAQVDTKPFQNSLAVPQKPAQPELKTANPPVADPAKYDATPAPEAAKAPLAPRKSLVDLLSGLGARKSKKTVSPKPKKKRNLALLSSWQGPEEVDLYNGDPKPVTNTMTSSSTILLESMSLKSSLNIPEPRAPERKNSFQDILMNLGERKAGKTRSARGMKTTENLAVKIPDRKTQSARGPRQPNYPNGIMSTYGKNRNRQNQRYQKPAKPLWRKADTAAERSPPVMMSNSNSSEISPQLDRKATLSDPKIQKVLENLSQLNQKQACWADCDSEDDMKWTL